MPERDIMPARTIVGFDKRRFSLFPDEITTFLINCNDLGLNNVNQIIEQLEAVKSITVANSSSNQVDINEKLLKEIILVIQGAIFEEH